MAAVPLGFLAAAGYAASLPLQDRLIRNTEDAIQGQVLGLHMNGVMLWQAVGALIMGVIASFLPRPPSWARCGRLDRRTFLLVPGLRRPAPGRPGSAGRRAESPPAGP